MEKIAKAILGCTENNPNSVIERAIEVEHDLPLASGSYPAPAPAVSDITTALAAAQAAKLAAVGHKRETTEGATYVDTIKTLYGLLRQECDYVNNTTPGAEVLLNTTGFPVSHDSESLPLLDPPGNFHRIMSKNIGLNRAKLKCDRPSNAADSQRPHYKYYRATSDDFSTAIVIGEGTKTSFIDNPHVSVATQFHYWVSASSPAGESDPSTPLVITVLATPA